jgi:hypothetical protein
MCWLSPITRPVGLVEEDDHGPFLEVDPSRPSQPEDLFVPAGALLDVGDRKVEVPDPCELG